ncbi:MAG: glycerophosphodiester phosphodiesterase [Betaproteobacteria bacterium]|nr:glycerophosphodiester phosphodiesterase [Betaproteobacteria bacterium]
MTWPYPRIVAHRGGGKLAPENTLGAIRHGASMGFEGVEFDVMLAGDATPVLIHDETVDRTTDGRGAVAQMTYAELSKFSIEKKEKIPTFESAARLCRELGVWANVEIKPALGYERRTGEAVALAARAHWRGAALLPVLSSFSTVSLAAAAAAAPELPRGLLAGRVPKHWRQLMRDFGCVALHCNHRSLTQRLAQEIHAAGYAVLCWTVNDRRAAKKLLGWGVECLVTDRLDRIGPDFR